MTKQEAIEAMEQGKLVSHRTFGAEEYIGEFAVNYFRNEEGYIIPKKQFWKYKNHPNFNKDWKIFSNLT